MDSLFFLIRYYLCEVGYSDGGGTRKGGRKGACVRGREEKKSGKSIQYTTSNNKKAKTKTIKLNKRCPTYNRVRPGIEGVNSFGTCNMPVSGSHTTMSSGRLSFWKGVWLREKQPAR